ncbi:MAG: hypothetical protein KF832_30975 [Caldilineaceae bacterium]|nr:hypothetical protein [Caldilineaceae bacterium]
MQWRLHLLVGVLASLLLFLSGCSRTEATPVATVAPPTATTVPVEATATTAPEPSPTATTAPTTPKEAVEQLLFQSLQLTKPATDSIGIEGIYAFPLETTTGQELWLAHTLGIRNFDPLQNHVIAIYEKTGDSWQALTQLELVMRDDPADPGVSPDYLGEGSVTQVQIEPDHLWIQVEGGAGAHSGVYGLFRFDGSTLQEEISSFNSSPGVGRVEDLDGDGTAEVLLNASDPYVFCYACGVRLVNWAIERWDGTQMITVTLAALSADAPAAVSEFNQTLIDLAQAGLWKDALAMLDEGATFSYTEPALTWNLIYVRVNGEARRDATNEPAYPLLAQLFYGDYDAVLELLQSVGADGLFTPTSELIVGTVAESWEPTLADWIVNSVDPALALQPDLAPAYFLRGWAAYLREHNLAAAVPDVQQAADLAPDEALYTKSLEFLTE